MTGHCSLVMSVAVDTARSTDFAAAEMMQGVAGHSFELPSFPQASLSSSALSMMMMSLALEDGWDLQEGGGSSPTAAPRQ